MSTVGADAPLRSDARRTRDRLLEAAGELLEAGGQHFTLPELARQAGVGTATVYRHFTDVAEVLTAVEVQSIEALTAAIADLPPADPRLRFDHICVMWVGRSTRESAAVRFLRSPEGVLQRADRGDPSISALLAALSAVLDDLVTAGLLPRQDITAAALIWLTLFDERLVIDLARTLGWTTRHVADYLGQAVLGALAAG